MNQRHTERGFDRLVNFSDAVVAIAITLLVLPLTEIAGDAEKYESVGELLDDHSGVLSAFLISFVVLANYWLIHHRIFEWINGYDSALAWLNIGWLLFIVLIPFTTEVITNLSFGAGSGVMYSGNLAAIGLFLALIGWHVKRTPALQVPGFENSRMRLRKSFIYVGYFVAIGALSTVAPEAASWAMLGLIPLALLIKEKGADQEPSTAPA